MKTRGYILALAVAVLFCVGWTYQARTRWEYKFIYRADIPAADVNKMLNDAGAEGWELMYVRPRDGLAGGDYIFKRPK
ncbi:MAG TPA: hypothetical protein VGB98_02470 [Pyrinomonadaceae bacterium]|jgi:hypothetical protein